MKIILDRVNQDFLFQAVNNNGHKVLLDNKSKKEGEVEGISPMELLLMGLAGCSGIDIISILEKQKINPTSLKMEVEGERKKNQVPSLFEVINVKVMLEGDIIPEKVIRAVKLSFDKYCSVSKTLEKTAKINYQIFLNGKKL
jgi:putative redox protein|tara:strand:- start:4519 stop:4944 length:426 start_codon:yes stop_codon:yes gene_type:complete